MRDSCLTRIVATVGPASRSEETLAALLEAGVSVFRLNFSHGSLEEHAAAIAAIRAAERATGRVVATLGDLPGPKIRVAALDAPIELASGMRVRIGFGGRSDGGDEPRLACTYEGLVEDAEPGHRILIDDGAVRLLAVERGDSGDLVCTTLVGGPVSNGKGINLPDSAVRAEPITERDAACAAMAIGAGIDYLAMSFVQHEEDLRRLRQLVRELSVDAGRAEPPPIVAKIERPSAIERIEAIIEAADAIMVARGDLGVELDLARVPILQKRMLAAARAAGKPAIVATQMLQSMIESASPTRAEASDVANAILDGCDAVMLSGETAVGRRPVLVVETMVRIAREAEALQAERPREEGPPAWLVRERDRLAALGHGASRAARELGACAVVAWSDTGRSALLLSRLGFAIPIHALGTDLAALRRMRLFRGVEPIHVERVPERFDEFASHAEELLRRRGTVGIGDRCLYVSGERFRRDPPQAVVAVREVAPEHREGGHAEGSAS